MPRSFISWQLHSIFYIREGHNLTSIASLIASISGFIALKGSSLIEIYNQMKTLNEPQ
jgi:hypothetical protein